MPNPASFKAQNNRTVPLDRRRLLLNESITTSANRQGKVSPNLVSVVLVRKKTAAQICAITNPRAILVQIVSIVRINFASPIIPRSSRNCFYRDGYRCWKYQPEHGSAFWPILAVDFSAMLPDDPIACAESEPHTPADGLGGIERLKNAPRLFQARTGVYKPDLDMLFDGFDSDCEQPCFVSFHRINRIRDEMQEDLDQLIGVALDRGYKALFLDLDSYAVSTPGAC